MDSCALRNTLALFATLALCACSSGGGGFYAPPNSTPSDTMGGGTDFGALPGGDTGGATGPCTNECSTAGARRCDGNGFVVCGPQHDADSCLEWGSIQPCREGEICSNGTCAVGCADECTTAGARQCGRTGVQSCGNHDDDTCLEWGPDMPCQPGETCSGGMCSVGCKDECSTYGALRCDGSAVRRCGNHDADACLEWGDPVPCGVGETCSNGVCSTGCSHECSTDGAGRCEGNGTQTCSNHDTDDCLEWGSTVPCGAGQTCSNGICSTGCSHECTTKGARRCEGNGFQACGSFDEDDCLEWGSVLPCRAGETCSNGNCSTTCADECSTVGAKRCEGSGVRTCGDYDEDACLEWGSIVACEQGTCSNGVCSLECADECTTDGARRCEGNAAQKCGQFDADSCLEWSTPIPCPEGQTCSGGNCSTTCTDECTASGARKCEGNSVQTCGNVDRDPCLEWGTPSACEAGQICSGGTCAVGCSDECTVRGAKTCEGDGFKLCDDYNRDDCLEWGSVQPCATGHTCSNGACTLRCTDECDSNGATECQGEGVRTCGDFDADSCKEWGTTVPCPTGQTCSRGVCSAACQDECEAEGITRCEGNAVVTCGNTDSDTCLEWGTPLYCELGQACQSGSCQAVSGDKSCAEINDCLIGCGDNGDCATTCINAGTTTGQDRYKAFADCASLNACADTDCFGRYCAPEIAACITEQSGSKTCNEIIECQRTCEPTDQACADGCFDSGSREGQGRLMRASACLNAACPNVDDAECPNTALSADGPCGVAYAECVAPDEEGSGCMELNDCLSACAEGDEACSQACVDAASFLGGAELSAVSRCSSDHACNGEAGCMADHCGLEYAQCLASSAGTSACGDVADCSSACAPEDQGCADACLDKGTLRAQEVYIKTVLCLSEACPDGDENCVSAAQQDQCAQYVAECFSL